MDLKALIAKMDQIESKQVLTESEDRPDAKKKETSWTDKSGKKHPATQVQGHQSVKADKEADKEKKKDLDEMNFQSGIAQALLKEFNLEENPFSGVADYFKKNAADYRARQASGELPPDGWDQERDGPWMGKNPAMANVVDGSGNPIKTGSGGNLQSLGQQPAGGAGTKPAAPTGAPGAQDDVTGVDAAVAAQQAASGPTDAEIAANNAALAGWNETDPSAGAATKPAEPAAEPAKGGINPTVLNRYKELLDKLEGGKAPAAAPAKKPATGAATKPATGAATKPAAGGPKVPSASMGANSPAYDTQDQGQISSTPAAESMTLRDDQILALIKGI